MSVRARTFWIALPVAVVLALWLGPGLAPDEALVAEPTEAPPPAPAADPGEAARGLEARALEAPTPPEPALDPECEPTPDYGPDGDG